MRVRLPSGTAGPTSLADAVASIRDVLGGGVDHGLGPVHVQGIVRGCGPAAE